jgi:hypothetical protein
MDRLDKQPEIARISPTKPIVLKFVLIGGIGLPVFFLAAWQFIERAISTNWNGVMLAWLHEFQVMLWPSSLLMLATPEDYLNVTYLLVALAANVVLYGLVGLLVAKGLRSPALLCAVGLLLLCGLLFLNRFWSGHVISFVLVGLALTAILFYVGSPKRKLGGYAPGPPKYS